MDGWALRTISRRVFKVTLAIALTSSATSSSRAQSNQSPSTTRVPVVFSGGHETDPRDRGRPVVLIAAALGVPADVFREAFSHVRPAPAGTAPDPRQVRDNKAALLDALGPYGITNERLDTVSDYYRYVRRRGKLWPTKPASAYALVRDGKIVELRRDQWRERLHFAPDRDGAATLKRARRQSRAVLQQTIREKRLGRVDQVVPER